MQPKYQVIASELKSQIRAGRFKDVNMLPTEFELMDIYSVSRQTIRQALAILEKEGLIEKRRGSGSHIRRAPAPETPSQRRTIAVVTTYISNYIFPSILREVEEVLSRNNCVPLLFATQNQVSVERKVLTSLLDTAIDGIIVEGTKTALPNPNLDLYRKLIDKQIPIVFINGSYPQLPETVSVIDDNEGGGKMLVEYLAAKGHKKIAGIFKSDDMQGHGRYAGYAAGLQSAGLGMDDSLVQWYNTDVKQFFLTEEVFTPLIRNWQNAGCTAVVCYNDDIACLMISLMSKCGISVPEQMAVVSFDNSYLTEIGSIPLTSLSHGGANVGSIAAQKLLSLMNGEHVMSERIPWEIIKRVSG